MCGCDLMQTGMEEVGDDDSNDDVCIVPEMRRTGEESILGGGIGKLSVVEA